MPTFNANFEPTQSQHQSTADFSSWDNFLSLPQSYAEQLPPSVVEFFEFFDQDNTELMAKHHAAVSADRSVQDEINDAKLKDANDLNAAEREGVPIDPKLDASNKALIARAERKRERTLNVPSLTVAALSGNRDTNNRAITYVRQALDSGAILELAKVRLKGKDPLETAEATPLKIAALQDQAKLIRKASDPADVVKAKLHDHVEKLAEVGRPQATFGRMGPGVRLAQIAVKAEPSQIGGIPTAPDAGALIAWALKDQLLAELDRQVDAHYEGVELALSEDDKRQKLAELDAEILSLERIEAESVWQARAAGYEISQRPGLDPRAVLGLDGPPPTRRR